MEIKRDEFVAKYGVKDLAGSERAPLAATPGVVAGQNAVMAVYLGVARRIIKSLSDRGGTASLFALVDDLDASVDELKPVVLWLEQQQGVRVLDRTKQGDLKLEATALADKLVKP